MTYALVAVPVPLAQPFSYRVPESLRERLVAGARVQCPFGRRKIHGVVLELTEVPPAGVPLDKLRDLEAIVDAEPVLQLELLAFLRELSRYYLAPIGDVMRLALPAVERGDAAALAKQGLALAKGAKTVGRLEQRAILLDDANADGLKGQALGVYEALAAAPERTLRVAELAESFGNARTVVKRLGERGLVRVEQVASSVDPFLAPVQRDAPPVLNAAQTQASAALIAALDERASRSFLLHGVTGSGKTEVYLAAASHAASTGGGVIVLVPEIALTPQLAGRFRARLGDAVAIVHSALTESARHSMWRRVRSGEVRVVVGARSALFAPVRELRLLCVDEEHDGSYKQEEGVRYQARDMALLRAHRAGAVCVLGSATPSLETEQLSRSGRMARLSLPERAHREAVLPKIELVDLRKNGAGPSGERLLTLPLHRALEQTLAAGEQAILFLNRRGFAPHVVCEGCGESVECPSCAVGLTFHRTPRSQLVCHYCAYEAPVPKTCSRCSCDRLAFEGMGTEKIEESLAAQFPQARIARLDRDVAGGAKSEPILDKMRNGELDILVGTQMVTKGHDLPSVTLVGVLSADGALGLPDFRAAERTFSQLVQVAGRAGRAGKAGRVLIQTRNADHAAIRLALTHDVEAFVDAELRERRELLYPPFARLAMVRVDSMDEVLGRREVERLAGIARKAKAPEVALMGPTAAPLARLRNRFRFRFMLRSVERTQLRPPLIAVLRAEVDRHVRVAVDVDPVSML